MYTINRRESKKNTSRNYCALAYRLDTECKYTYGQNTLSVPEGSVVLVPAGLDYTTNSKKGTIFAIHFNTRSLPPQKILHLATDQNEMLKALFMQCLTAWENRTDNQSFKAQSLFYEILHRIKVSQIKSNPSENSLAKTCKNLLEKNISNADFTISDAAKSAYVSEAYLRKKFRECYGISPKHYLLQKRLELAKSLIYTGYFSQKEVCRKCGFSDVKYFRTAFKNHTGKSIRNTPREMQ